MNLSMVNMINFMLCMYILPQLQFCIKKDKEKSGHTPSLQRTSDLSRLHGCCQTSPTSTSQRCPWGQYQDVWIPWILMGETLQAFHTSVSEHHPARPFPRLEVPECTQRQVSKCVSSRIKVETQNYAKTDNTKLCVLEITGRWWSLAKHTVSFERVRSLLWWKTRGSGVL